MKTNQQIAAEVLMGQWGNGEERKTRLHKAGYNPEAVQSIVNALVAGDIGEQTEKESGIKFTGTETLNVEIDVTKYNALAITFVEGAE